MRILCCEYLHASAEAYSAAPVTMQHEAASMLRAVIDDLRQIPDVEIIVFVSDTVSENVASPVAQFSGSVQCQRTAGSVREF